jgi:hypothetical protein
MFRTDPIKSFNLVSFILFFLLVIQLCIFSWCINRGFDFSDEAFGYLGFLRPEEVQQAATYYVVLYNVFFGRMEVDIINVRIIRLLFLLISSAVFASGLIAWVRRKNIGDTTQHINLLLFVLLGGLFINASGTQALTYNLFSTVFFLLATGFFLYVFQREIELVRSSSIIFFAIGGMLFALFLIKFSNAVFLSIALVVLLIYDKRNIKTVAIYSACIVGGALITGLILFGMEFPQWLYNYYAILTSLTGTSYTSILDRYVEDFMNVRDNLLLANLVFIVIGLLLLALNRYVEKRVLKIMIALVFACLMTYFSYLRVYYLGGIKYVYVVTFFYILLNFILFCGLALTLILDRAEKKSRNTDLTLIIIFLFFIPFFGSVGTTNYLTVQIFWYAPFVFALLFLLLQIHGGFLLNIMLVVLSVNAILQAVSGLIYYPYRITETLFEQSYRLSSEVSEERILLDKELKKSVETVYNLIRSKTNFADGGPIFSFRYEYGFIYFLRGTLPGWSWYTDEASAGNCLNLKKTNLKNLNQTIFIFPEGYVPDSIFVSCLKDLEIDFYADYKELGKTEYFIDGVNRPLKIYAPERLFKITR